MHITEKLEKARQVARSAYAKHGLSNEYDAAMAKVKELAEIVDKGMDLSSWRCDSDGEWWI